MKCSKNVLRLLVAMGLTVSCSLRAQDPPCLIVVSIDGLRHDALSLGVTKTLSAFCAQGVRAKSLNPVFPSLTYPNHNSMMTGLYPEAHGIVSNYFRDPVHDVEFDHNSESIQAAQWWEGEFFWEAARTHGIRTAALFWPGAHLWEPARQPDYWKPYDRKTPYAERLETVLSWLRLPNDKRPRFVCLYLEGVDIDAHRYGPEAPEVATAISRVDRLLLELLNALDTLPYRDSVNMVIVSDHGMTDIDHEKVVDVGPGLRGFDAKALGFGSQLMIWPKDPSKAQEIAVSLRAKTAHAQIYLKNEIPDAYHYRNNPRIAPILVVADLHYTVVDLRGVSPLLLQSVRMKGNHGFDPAHRDMHGVFMARGPAFAQGVITKSINAVDVYAVFCKVLSVPIREGVAARAERVAALFRAR